MTLLFLFLVLKTAWISTNSYSELAGLSTWEPADKGVKLSEIILYKTVCPLLFATLANGI